MSDGGLVSRHGARQHSGVVQSGSDSPMKALHYLILALLIPVLGACKPEPEPARVVPEKVPPAVVEPEPAAQNTAPEVVVPPETTPKATPRPAVTRASPASAAEGPADPPKTKLDLSLPPELVEQLNAEDQGLETAMTPLLPPLFEPRRPVENPFQLSGRLLTNDDNKDYWDSVEGAELQFEFKR